MMDYEIRMPSKTSFAENYRSPILLIESKRVLSSNIPKDFSEDLCWLLGLLHGDGNMSSGRILFCDKDERFHKVVTQRVFRRVFGISLNLFHDVKRNSFYSHVKNKQIFAFLTRVLQVPSGAVRNQLRVPTFLNALSDSLKAAYVAGLFDAEGSVRFRQAELHIPITSKEIWSFVCRFLDAHAIACSPRIRRRRKRAEYEIYVYGKTRLKHFSDLVPIRHPRKSRRLALFVEITKHPSSPSSK